MECGKERGGPFASTLLFAIGVLDEEVDQFPHRNVALGRVSTPEEIEFLKQPGSSF